MNGNIQSLRCINSGRKVKDVFSTRSRRYHQGCVGSERQSQSQTQTQTNALRVHVPLYFNGRSGNVSNKTHLVKHTTAHIHINNRTCMPAMSMRRTFAVKINFGQGDTIKQFEKLSNGTAKTKEKIRLSRSQQKSANVQLKQITNSTNRILNIDVESEIQTNEVESLANEVLVALHYWTSKWIPYYHPFIAHGTHVKGLRYDEQSASASASDASQTQSDEHCYGDYGPKQAERLLHWLLKIDQIFPQHKFVERVISNGNSGNALFANMVDAYILPCNRSSHDVSMMDDFVQFSRSTGNVNVNSTIWGAAVYDACRILDVMGELLARDDLTFRRDVHTDNAILRTWLKLSILRGLESVSDCSGAGSGVGSGASVPTSLEMGSVQEVVKSMEQKLEEMEQIYFTSKDEFVKPNKESYIAVLRAILEDGENSADRIQWYLRRMERAEDLDLGTIHGNRRGENVLNENEDEHENDRELLPLTAMYADEEVYNMAIHANVSKIVPRLDSALKVQIAEKADSILRNMEERYERITRDTSRPSTITYTTTLKGWTNAGQAAKAENILNKMISLSENSNPNVTPNRISFNTVLDGWARTKGRDSSQRAVDLLEQMEQFSENEVYSDVYPDTITYSSVITALARSDRRDAGQRAEDLLRRSLHLFHEGKKDLKPDSVTFNTVLDALSKQVRRNVQHQSSAHNSSRGDVDTLRKAEAVFEEMKQFDQDGDSSVRPCTISYNIMLGMYAVLMNKDKAESLYNDLCGMYEDGDTRMKPDIITYNNYLFALANSMSRADTDKAISLLKKMENIKNSSSSTSIFVQPDANSYLAIIRALAKQSKNHSDAAKKCDSILKRMEDRIRSGETEVRPCVVCYNCCIDAYAKSESNDGEQSALNLISRMQSLSVQLDAPDLRPNIISYTSALNAIANSKDRSAPDRAKALLNQMAAEGVKPNSYTYNNLINCWAQSGRNDAAERAEEILMKMQQVSRSGDSEISPNQYTFVSVINCWARSHDKNAAKRAEDILDLMENRGALGDKHLQANKYTYGAVLNAWSRSPDPDAPKKALRILRRMEERYKEGDSGMKPNLHAYNLVMNAIAKGSSPKKAAEVEHMLKLGVENHDIVPTTITYGTILNACAYTKGSSYDKIAAFKIARKTFKKILSECDPNHIVFTAFLKACINLVPPGPKRDQLVKSVFQECCQFGMVSQNTILSLRRALSEEKLDDILHGTTLARGRIDIEDLPFEWRKRTKGVRSHG